MAISQISARSSGTSRNNTRLSTVRCTFTLLRLRYVFSILRNIVECLILFDSPGHDCDWNDVRDRTRWCSPRKPRRLATYLIYSHGQHTYQPQFRRPPTLVSLSFSYPHMPRCMRLAPYYAAHCNQHNLLYTGP